MIYNKLNVRAVNTCTVSNIGLKIKISIASKLHKLFYLPAAYLLPRSL